MEKTDYTDRQLSYTVRHKQKFYRKDRKAHYGQKEYHNEEDFKIKREKAVLCPDPDV